MSKDRNTVVISGPVSFLVYVGFGALIHWLLYGSEIQGIFSLVVVGLWPFFVFFYILIALAIIFVIFFIVLAIYHYWEIHKKNKIRNELYKTYKVD